MPLKSLKSQHLNVFISSFKCYFIKHCYPSYLIFTYIQKKTLYLYNFKWKVNNIWHFLHKLFRALKNRGNKTNML